MGFEPLRDALVPKDMATRENGRRLISDVAARPADDQLRLKADLADNADIVDQECDAGILDVVTVQRPLRRSPFDRSPTRCGLLRWRCRNLFRRLERGHFRQYQGGHCFDSRRIARLLEQRARFHRGQRMCFRRGLDGRPLGRRVCWELGVRSLGTRLRNAHGNDRKCSRLRHVARSVGRGRASSPRVWGKSHRERGRERVRSPNLVTRMWGRVVVVARGRHVSGGIPVCKQRD